MRQKTRECVLPDGARQGDLFCPGDDLMKESCNENKCPELGPWSQWTQCSVTCGGGKRSRERECGLPKERNSEDNPCKQPLFEEEDCNENVCPTVTEWTEWSACSKTCGGGFRKKTRECKVQNSISSYTAFDNPCKKPLEVIEECNDHKCPMWTEWGDWTECSKTCGGGQKRKYRQCVDHEGSRVSTDNCVGDEEMAEKCNTQACPFWTEWSEWTQCSATCGGGRRSKIRECIVSEPSNERSGDGEEAKSLCEGEPIAEEDCNTNVCPEWSDWTEWTQCSATCGGGVQKRIRDCLLPEPSTRDSDNGSNDYGCTGDPWEMRDCNENDCPVWTEWTEWSPCTRSCGGGKRVKTRKCVLPESLGKDILRLFCPGDEEVIEDCNTDKCPVPGQWSEWSECSKSCGGGTRTKVRECINQRDKDGNPCNADLIETEACNEEPCPVWTDWTEWTPCTKTCGGGSRKKVRECVLPKSEDPSKCSGDSEMVESCNEDTCPSLTPWSEWTECSATCGGGSQRRVRDCLVQRNAIDDNPCFEPLEEVRECNQDRCPKWTDWSEWTECTKSCGGGQKSRIRECVLPKSPLDPSACAGGARNETMECNEQPCPAWTPWTEWSECSATCGGGTQHRARECKTPVIRNGELSCEGSAFEDRQCNNNDCPQWTEWSPWSECTKTCGGGTRQKTRTCPVEGESYYSDVLPCGEGDTVLQEPCNVQECLPDPEWSDWTPWSTCSQTCGGGTTRRSRTCEVQVETPSLDIRRGKSLDSNVTEEGEDKPCPGPSTMVMFCNLDECPPETNWGPWGPWGECTKKCGGGKRTRKRQCVKVERYGQPLICLGSSEEEDICNEDPCAQWTDWGPWSQCSASCGAGSRTRYRKCRILTGDEVYNTPFLKEDFGAKLGLLYEPCPGLKKEVESCDSGPCTSQECTKMGLPSSFKSFSGRPAKSTGIIYLSRYFHS